MSITLSNTEKAVIDAANSILDDSMTNGVSNTATPIPPLAGYEKAASAGKPPQDYRPQVTGPFKMALVALMRSVEAFTVVPDGSLSNGWLAFDTTNYNAPGYYKDPLGTVHLQGLVKDGSNNTIFTLPANYRPNKSLIISSISNNGISNTLAEIKIEPNGNIKLLNGDNTWLTLENISFRAYQ